MTGLRSAVSCFDRLFDKALSDRYCLSIRFEPDGLFLSVFDSAIGKYIGFESTMHTGVTGIYEHIARHDFLTRSFRKVICIIPSSKYTIVPDALFIPGSEKEYFSFAHELSADEELKTIHLSIIDSQVIYAADMAYYAIIQEFFPSAQVMPGVASFTSYILPRNRNISEPVMFMNIHHDNFDMLIMNSGKMVFCNNFNWNAPEDIVYYAIFVIDQLKINAEKAAASFSGRINTKSDIIKLMRKYIKTVDVLIYNQDVQLSYALSEIDIFNFPDLFNQRLCE